MSVKASESDKVVGEEKRTENGLVLIPQPSDDPEDPLNWTSGRKAKVVATLFLAMFQQAALYGKTPVQITYFNSAASAGLATGGYLWWPLSSKFGRSSIIFWTLFGQLAAQIWAPLMTKPHQYAPYLVSRYFSAFFGATASVLGPRYLVDMYFLHQRGRAFTVLHLALNFGASAGPTFGGFVAANAYWPVEYWWSVALTGLTILIVFFFLEETSYDRTKGASKPKSWLRNCLDTFFPGTKVTLHPTTWRHTAKIAITPFKIAIAPVLLIIAGFDAISFGFYVALNALTPVWLQRPLAAGGIYGWNVTQNAAFTFIHWIGFLIGLIYGHLLTDRIPLYLVSRNKSRSWKPEYRLHALWPTNFVLMPLGLGLVGCAMQYKLHWFVMALAQFFVTIGSLVHAGNVQYCLPATLWNPHKVNTLADFRVEYLTEVIPYNQTHDKKSDTYADDACPLAANLLSIKDIVVINEDDPPEKALHNPINLNVGAAQLGAFASNFFPSPLNGSSPGEVVDWWLNATAKDTENVTALLDHISRVCWYEYCRSKYVSIGNPDVVGYGMFVSVIILLVLAFFSSLLAIHPIAKRLRREKEAYIIGESPKTRFNFRLCVVKCVPHLLAAALVFAGSVMASSYVYRWTTHSRFDALMADALTMLSVTAVTMICAAFWATRTRPSSPGYVTASVALLSVLNIVMFFTHHTVYYKPGKIIEQLCSRSYDSMKPDVRYSHSQDFLFFVSAFSGWVAASLGMAYHHPAFRERRQHMTWKGWKKGLMAFTDVSPALAGTTAMLSYAKYYWKARGVMKEVYGEAFVDAIKTWGFGQYLALATWAPPILLFLYLFFIGSGKKLEPAAREKKDVQ
ncbi:hypothetical protein OQA88_8717 [Cercophora sp. LCS_1]